MKLMTFKPATAARTARSMDDLFTTFFRNDFPAMANQHKLRNAAVNIVETEDSYRLEMAAPGWSKADFNINVEQDTLTISAKREEETKQEGENHLRTEFRVENIERSFTLPETIELDNINATYENGVLSLVLPKKEEAKPLPPRKVEIA